MTDRDTADPTLGALVNQLTTQVPELIRSEIRLAQAEIAEKGKSAGLGIGMFTLVTTAILALATAVDAWLAALIVALVLLVAAAAAGLVGKNKVAAAGPPKPELALDGLKEDIQTVKGNHHG